MTSRRFTLTIIVLAQFCCTSIWFASNAVIGDLLNQFQLGSSALGHLTSSVQIGFISGTLAFALLMIPDRFSPSKVFFLSAILAAIFNAGLIFENNTFLSLTILRFLAGFTLAGIYPVGMKIAADYFPKTLGLALSVLVGALVLGTALPHLLKSLSIGLSWKVTILSTSALCLLGGTLIYGFIKDGPFRVKGHQLKLGLFFKVFENKTFRASALGYFSHMWELYAYWAFVPIILTFGLNDSTLSDSNISLLTFFIIAMGSLACIIGGLLSSKIGVAKTAFLSLSLSGICCLICPFVLLYLPFNFRVVFMILWGMFVIADSPLFSSLVAGNATSETKGSALTIVNCIGFAITIISIELMTSLQQLNDNPYIFMTLAIGPIIGIWLIKDLINQRSPNT